MESLLFLGGPVLLGIQILCCIHSYRTGRPYWWMWIILMGSLVGCLLYLILELLPEARRSSRGLIKLSWFVPRSVLVKRARETLEESETAENRLRLAELLYDSGSPAEAEAVAAPAISGVFKRDALLISEVAWYKAEVGKIDESETLLSNADLTSNRSAVAKIDLLKARILFTRGQHELALERFKDLQNQNLGEEPRFYVARCFGALDRKDEALKTLEAIQTKYRKSNRMWRRSEKAWYKQAKLYAKEVCSPSTP